MTSEQPILKILFLCTKRSDSYGSAIGLSIQSKLTAQVLREQIIADAIVSIVNDSNDIDREVSRYHPDIVILEALWVPPSKFKELISIHPNILWITRIHSNIPFLSIEGQALSWLYEYYQLSTNILIAVNHTDMIRDMSTILPKDRPIIYLPNLYEMQTHRKHQSDRYKDHIDIGCFGAIRPMKNQLVQAIAAIRFGESIGYPIHFHINATRCEGQGDNILKNLRSLFSHKTAHKLIEHKWHDYHDFLDVVSTMDLGMQVSMSETFNIVTADFVSCNVPVIVSEEVDWITDYCKVEDPTDSNDIYHTMKKVSLLSRIQFHRLNKWMLNRYQQRSIRYWISTISDIYEN